MNTYILGEQRPQIQDGCYVAATATLIGSVILKRNASVWFNVVIRGDNDLIVVGENSNVQDGSILHTDKGIQLTIGEGVSVGHAAILHGCQIGDHTLVGIGSVILNRVKVGRDCLIGARTLITEGKSIPDRSVVMGSPGEVVRSVTEEDIRHIRGFAERYLARSRRYQAQLKRGADPG